MDRIDALIEERDKKFLLLSHLRDLEADAGWALVRQELEATVRVHRIVEFDSDIASLDDAFKSARTRGFLSGITSSIKLIDTMIENLDADLTRLKIEIEEESR